jgi:hypothetical protein
MKGSGEHGDKISRTQKHGEAKAQEQSHKEKKIPIDFLKLNILL